MPPLFKSKSKMSLEMTTLAYSVQNLNFYMSTYMPVAMVVNRQVYFTFGNFLSITQLHLQLI